VAVSNASVEGKPCAKGSCPVAKDTVMLQKVVVPVAKDTVMLQKAALHHRGILQVQSRDAKEKTRDSSSSSALAAYTAQLFRSVHTAHVYREPANTEIEEVIDKVAAHQAEAGEKCGAQLKDAKDHLNKLHDTVEDLATEINSTTAAVKAQQFQLGAKKDQEEDVKKWKEESKVKCDKEKEDRKKNLKTLKEDLSEIKQIAAQSNATSGAALLEEGAFEYEPGTDLHKLVLVAKSAAEALTLCVKTASTRTHAGVSLMEAPEVGTPTPDECQEAKKKLSDSVSKPFVELTRQVAENEDAVEDTACEDTIHEEFKSKIAPILKDTEKFATKLEDATSDLSELRPRLDDGKNTVKKLQDKVEKLGKECESLPEVMKDLDKIKDVIKIMDKCPGLGQAKINVPTWIGEWVTVQQKADETDEALDARLNEACGEAKGVEQPVRAAEVGEILAVSVVGMPSTVTAKDTLIGACPFCAGDDDSKTGMKHASAHARIGWDAGVAISEATKRKDCSTGLRAVLCVKDSSSAPTIDVGPGPNAPVLPAAPSGGDEGNDDNDDVEADAGEE
jgi:uncharacterized coiled-coil DUF342 family protein